MQLDHITYLAATDARGRQQAFGIKSLDRHRHMYIIGKTGMGKSVLLENMAIQDIQNGEGFCFIDPHGSTAEKLLDFIPEHRIEDVIYFAPFDLDYPVAFNVMEDVGYDKRHLVSSGLMSAFKKIWEDAWSARMEYILTNTLLALLEYPDSTLLDVNRMLINKAFRKKVVEYVTDPIVKSFWVDKFANYTDRYTQDATPAIQNKVGQFTSNPLIRNIVGQAKSSFDLRQVMDNKKIFIANLSKGRMGETNADLIGSMLTTKIYLSAMSRADESAAVQAKLPPFYFYVDEFQSIANESFADILSEARKYKLALTIAHQYVEQMEENVRNAVFGNVGTTIAFRVGPFDAEVLETIFTPKFTAEDLVNLGRFQIYLTLMIDGIGSQPFSATTLPPIETPVISFRDRVLESSRTTYGNPRVTVEEDIRKHSEVEEEKKKPAAEKSAPSKARASTEGGNERPAPTPAPARELSPATPQEVKNERVHGAREQVRGTEQNKPQETPAVPRPQPPRPQNQKRNQNRNQNRERPALSLEALKQQQKSKGPSIEQLGELRKALAAAMKEAPAVSSSPAVPPKAPEPKKENPPMVKGTAKEEKVPLPQQEIPKDVLEKVLKSEE
ncbi:hypothetical protein A3D62_00355 [Candidatus Kaiserbacteria bacterium RIFCSPHIGHO2_02_FULL_49_11]|uniref:Type IV secretion system coupling protein TraD DNA-binding domain-containing protein n=1 Tax=Candidatus Kaiserbacteria bacterium RIFCSPHIGHO2_02_FULL_49_11 TaxID=1798489 RepID=A0A1F6D237_9BACT|nr:MAG: hypothetical protein A3D62_00355 [Candidatus Kaiserbacteria bacterium RIFCSPHIGHO2_02_FULL_49_11]